MFNFEDEKKLLSEHFIPDISNLIISYINTPLESFEDIDIEECCRNGDHIYFDKYRTLLIFLCTSGLHSKLLNYHELCIGMLNNITYFKADHFQNKYMYERTELYYLCKNNMFNIIFKFKDLKPKHFQNKDAFGMTELYQLCKNKRTDVLMYIKGLTPNHFLNKDINKTTELYYLIYNEMIDVIKHIGFKLEHCNSDFKKEFLRKIL